MRLRMGWLGGRVEIGERVIRELYIPVSQSMSVPRTSKEQALKWVRGVEEGTWVMIVAGSGWLRVIQKSGSLVDRYVLSVKLMSLR